MSSGILLHRTRDGIVEVFIAHMGGPFWSKKDAGAWSILKGKCLEGEEPLAAARREFEEETGRLAPDGPLIPLGEVRQSSGKVVAAWAVAGDFDPDTLVSNTFTLEWPPRSGRLQEYPEIDRAAWFDPDTAMQKLVRAQARFVELLVERLDEGEARAPASEHPPGEAPGRPRCGTPG